MLVKYYYLDLETAKNGFSLVILPDSSDLLAAAQKHTQVGKVVYRAELRPQRGTKVPLSRKFKENPYITSYRSYLVLETDAGKQCCYSPYGRQFYRLTHTPTASTRLVERFLIMCGGWGAPKTPPLLLAAWPFNNTYPTERKGKLNG